MAPEPRLAGFAAGHSLDFLHARIITHPAARTEGANHGNGVCWRIFQPRTAVSELDRLKEQVAYLKFWQGIVVVTDISLGGWLVSASDTAALLAVVLAIAGVVLLSFGIVVLHRQIERRIDQIGKL